MKQEYWGWTCAVHGPACKFHPSITFRHPGKFPYEREWNGQEDMIKSPKGNHYWVIFTGWDNAP